MEKKKKGKMSPNYTFSFAIMDPQNHGCNHNKSNKQTGQIMCQRVTAILKLTG